MSSFLICPPTISAGGRFWLDRDELADIYDVMLDTDSLIGLVKWNNLANKGEQLVPYFEHILHTRTNSRIIQRALIFTREHLTKFDCKRLVEPTIEHFKDHNWEIRAEAMMLLREIGSQEDCTPVAVLLGSGPAGGMSCRGG